MEVMQADRDNLREEVKSMRRKLLSWRIAGRGERKKTDSGTAVWILIRQGLRANLFWTGVSSVKLGIILRFRLSLREVSERIFKDSTVRKLVEGPYHCPFCCK